MIPNLPRELLWRDKTDMTEFMSEELSNTVISVFNFAKTRITISLGSEMMLNLYNEAFYLCTRFVYEHDAAANPKSYREMIIDDLGKKELAEHVILIMFMILMLQPDKSKDVLLFADKLQKQYLQDTPFKILNWIHKVFKPRNNNASFTLKPCPYPADMLKNIYIDWCQITQGFSKHVIIDILDLWDDDIEKGKVIRLIEQAYTLCLPILKDEKLADRADKEFFTQQENNYKITKGAFNTNIAKGGRPVSKSLDELFTDKCSLVLRSHLINVVRMLKGKDAVFTLRVAASEDVGLIKKMPSYSKAKECFPNIGASSNYYRQRGNRMEKNEIEYYKSLLIPKDDK